MDRAIQNQYVPDHIIPPGEILLETLEERGMSQAELAERTGRRKKTINEIIKGKAPITSETAMHLERVLGVPAGFWNNLEQNYRADLARIEEHHRLTKEIRWLDNFPIKELNQKEWIGFNEDKVEQLKKLLNFFGVASPKQWHEVWNAGTVSFRKSPAFRSNPWSMAAWLRYGELAALVIDCRPYDKSGFKKALAEIRLLTAHPPEVFVPKTKRLCAEAGVAAVFVPELKKTRVSGATRWLTPNKALIQLSLRYKSNDQLWFTFFHEAGHILLHGKREVFVDNDENKGKKEDEANKFAANFLIPVQEIRNFLCSVKKSRISKAAITRFSREIGIAPGIVVGRLQHEGILPRSHCNDLKVFYEWSK
nr:addiction module antidote protein, HigA family [Deltaproteobacteria bacterium]